MRLLSILAFTCLTLTGCVTMDANQCSSANWYDLGWRDAMYGLQRMDAVYGEQCGKQGTKIDGAAYANGWQEGNWEYESRKKVGGVE